MGPNSKGHMHRLHRGWTRWWITTDWAASDATCWSWNDRFQLCRRGHTSASPASHAALDTRSIDCHPTRASRISHRPAAPTCAGHTSIDNPSSMRTYTDCNPFPTFTGASRCSPKEKSGHCSDTLQFTCCSSLWRMKKREILPYKYFYHIHSCTCQNFKPPSIDIISKYPQY